MVYLSDVFVMSYFTVLSEIWVNVKDNVRTMNPFPVTYFGNNACLTEGVP